MDDVRWSVKWLFGYSKVVASEEEEEEDEEENDFFEKCVQFSFVCVCVCE